MSRNVDALNILAMTADAEARSTASMIEMIAVAALVKLAPPKGKNVAVLTISQADLDHAMREHYHEAEYAEDGTMTIRVTLLDPSLDLGQDTEVTSEA